MWGLRLAMLRAIGENPHSLWADGGLSWSDRREDETQATFSRNIDERQENSINT